MRTSRLVYNLNNRPIPQPLARYAAGQEALTFSGARADGLDISAHLAGHGVSCSSSRLQALPDSGKRPITSPFRYVISYRYCLCRRDHIYTRLSLFTYRVDRDVQPMGRVAGCVTWRTSICHLIYGLAYTLTLRSSKSCSSFTGCIFCVLASKVLIFFSTCFLCLGIFNRETICFVTLFFLVLGTKPDSPPGSSKSKHLADEHWIRDYAMHVGVAGS